MIEKKSLAIPLWVEAIVVIVLLVMACVEFNHSEWFWAAMFGGTGIFFGISVGIRMNAGDKHGQA